MGYWGGVVKRAWRETRELVRLDSPGRIFSLLIGAAISAWLGWLVGHSLGAIGRGLATIGAVALAAILIFVWKLIALPPRIAIERASVARAERDGLQDQLAALSMGSVDFPDWGVRDLFMYLDPEIDHSQEVGGEVQDSLSLGQLRCWGRAVEGASRRRLPLVEIDKANWPWVRFTYWFLEVGSEQQSHTSIRREIGIQLIPSFVKEHADLRVNRGQALRIWPRPLFPSV